MRLEAIHDALAAKGLIPAEHLADAAYVSAEQLVAARERHRIDLIGPPRPHATPQTRTGGVGIADFAVDWDARVVRCPEGHSSAAWREFTRRVHDEPRGRRIRIQFAAADCTPCPSRARCTSGRRKGRQMTLHRRAEHEALAVARARHDTEAGQRLYAQRQGIEGTIAQGVRAFGLRRTRYRGLAKTGLQSVAIAAALNLGRLAAWFAERPLAPTRTSRFAALVA